MPLTTTIQTLTEYRDVCARALGYSAYSALDTNGAAVVDDALGFSLDEIAMDGNWKWAERESSFTTSAGYSTGTVTVTNLSTTVEGASSPAWSTGTNLLADDKINFGEDGFYRVASITDADTLELATAFAGTTAAGASYNSYRDEYDLADGVLELLSIRLLDPARLITIVSPNEWERITQGDWDTGEPEIGMLIGADQSESGNAGTNQKIALWPLPDATYAYTYTYRTLLALPSSGSTNLETGPHLSGLVFYRAMAEIYRRLQEPERQQEYQGQYEKLLVKAKRTDMNRTNRQRHMSTGQFSVGRNWWPSGWPDVTNQ